MSYSAFYDVNALEQVAINLFYGWGYNFYKLENQLRQDDEIVRKRASLVLNDAKKLILDYERNYRSNFPEPSRETPFPPSVMIKNATRLETMHKSIGSLQTVIENLPVPSTDRMTQRYRQEAQTLDQLGKIDSRLIGQAQLLFVTLENKNAEWLFENSNVVKDGIDAINVTLADRRKLLT